MKTEKEKLSPEYLKDKIDNAIDELVHDKTDLRNAYNYYNGVRSADQFKYLEDNFGIGTPTSVNFIPLVKKHIDALVGQFLIKQLKPKVTCKDSETLGKIEDMRNMEIFKEVMEEVNNKFKSYMNILKDEPSKKEVKELNMKLVEEITENKLDNFKSEFEIAAQHIITYALQSNDIHLKNKLRIMFLDLLISGSCYYRVHYDRIGEFPKVEVLNPLDVFYIKNTNDQFINDCDRVVWRKYMVKEQCLNLYGHLMTDEQRNEMMENTHNSVNRNARLIFSPEAGGLVTNTDATLQTTGFDTPYSNFTLRESIVCVYHVEWLSTEKIEYNDDVNVEGAKVRDTGFIMNRYEGIRIGDTIYIGMGKTKEVIRSKENPYQCKLSINGLSYNDRNGKPYSLVLATATLQDTYDLLFFHRDSLLANAGVSGDWVDVANVPTFLGESLPEAIMKWRAYKKQGLALIDSSQEGRANLNTIFQGYDNTVNGAALQSIQLAIQQIEDTCSSITGVFRESLGGIEQHDAVSNVQVGIQQTLIITKQYHFLQNMIGRSLLTDFVNNAKVSLKDGFTGSYVLGERVLKIFTIDPKNFSFTDYDIHISDSGDEIKDLQMVQELTMNLIKSGMTDVNTVLTMLTTESLTEAKEVLKRDVEKNMNTNKKLQEQAQQMEEMKKMIEQLQQENEKFKSLNKELDSKRLELDKYKVEQDVRMKEKEVDLMEQKTKKEIEVKEKALKTELLQQLDSNPNNDNINYAQL